MSPVSTEIQTSTTPTAPPTSQVKGASRPIRVLIISHTASPGGAEIALLNLVRLLDRRQVTPVVLFGADGPVVEQMRLLAESHVLPLPVAVGGAKKDSLGIRSLVQVRGMFISAVYICKLAQFIRRNNIDLVHTNSLKSHLLGGLAARLARRPVLWHVRNNIDSDYLPASVARTLRMLARWVPRFVIACSGATLRSVYPGAPDNPRPFSVDLRTRGAVVHDGTTAHASGEKNSKRDGMCRIALIGRISSWKGQHIFIRAADLVHQRFPNARFFIVGSALFGESEYDREVRSLTESLGLPGIVTFTGFRKDVLDVIREMDVIVHASTIGEPFGLVIVEGMAAGKPVIATNGGGVPEIVEHGKTGILIPMANVEAMADAISLVLANPVLAADMGARGRERVRENFTIEHTARKIEAVYQAMLSRL